jgi:uncharacterized protein (TIGR02145 family)
MRNKLSILFLFGTILLTLQSCSSDSIKIGEQEWMTKNLDLDKFRNGDPIPEAKTVDEWLQASELKQPAWCFYNNYPSNGAEHGRLYNWYALTDERGLAPEGWHIPEDEEWTQLTDFLGGESAAGNKLKSKSGWKNNDNTNESGFTALPSGLRQRDGSFGYFGQDGSYWSATETFSQYAWNRYLRSEDKVASRVYSYKEVGLSVRCIKDFVKSEKNKNGNQDKQKNQSGAKTYSREDFRNTFDDLTISQVYEQLGKPYTDYANTNGKERARAIYVYQNITYADDSENLDEQVVIYFRSYQNVIQNGSWPRKLWQLRVSKIEFQKTTIDINRDWN